MLFRVGLQAKRAMLERENINYFINAAASYGVPSRDLFQVGTEVILEAIKLIHTASQKLESIKNADSVCFIKW